MRQHGISSRCNIRLRILLVISLMWVGCDKTEVPKPPELQTDLSVDDLAHTMGIRWWTMKITQILEGERLCIAFVDHEGPVQFYPFPSFYKVGDRMKVVLSNIEGHNFTWSLVTPNRAHRALSPNHFYSFDGPMVERSSGQGAAIGDLLLK